ncbi:MAG TPA: adenylate/guanylate cyclase domain-containing protein [Leptospiraceae bacterium]|nr:adenylate/guanylate cyclase domain-containing protein [Leptospiraceae bacterium]HRG75564.1 adenylate/guanylate cyclase domain-containing protein [Leptospiraceae bacterium]
MKELFIFNPESYYSEDMKSLVSRDEFLTEFNEKIHEEEVKAEKVARIFIFASFLFGCLISYKYDTYLLAFAGGGLGIVSYFLGLRYFPYTYAQKFLNESILQWFILQYISQMHGMYEMHFAFFPITAMLIVYRDLSTFIITGLIPVTQHLLFFALQLGFGYDLREYFINIDNLTIEIMIYHLSVATLHLVIVGFFCVFFRDKIAFQYKTLLKQKYTEKQIFQEQENAINNQEKLIKSYARFVPEQLLRFLGKELITGVQLGDSINKKMAILFSDIRSFTTLSEDMSPEDNFKFLNSYLHAMGPSIRKNNGFIDKYMGDGIMAIFPEGSTDALQSAIEMLDELADFNRTREKNGKLPIRIGIGIHVGYQMFGIIGDAERLEGTVISDAVNTASRLEGLTKVYGSEILISEEALMDIENLESYVHRKLGYAQVKGKSKSIAIYEVFSGRSNEEIDIFQRTILSFELGLDHFQNSNYYEAKSLFEAVLKFKPNDIPSQLYLKKTEEAMQLTK